MKRIILICSTILISSLLISSSIVFYTIKYTEQLKVRSKIDVIALDLKNRMSINDYNEIISKLDDIDSEMNDLKYKLDY